VGGRNSAPLRAGILEIGNLIEEPFTAYESQRRPLLPLTEVCRTIRRDVRAIAQYAALAKNYSTPTIARGEPTFELPDGFRQLRAVLATSAAVATEVSEAAKKKATGGQDA